MTPTRKERGRDLGEFGYTGGSAKKNSFWVSKIQLKKDMFIFFHRIFYNGLSENRSYWGGIMNIPAGLRHLLEVYKLVNDSKYSHSEAFREIATRGRITEAAVRLACMRDIGVNTQELAYYLDPDNSELFSGRQK